PAESEEISHHSSQAVLRGAWHELRGRGPIRLLPFGQSLRASSALHDHFPTHWSTQSFTVLYQSWEFCGLSTQWPSSGKYNILDGTSCICSVVNSCKPSLTSRR